MEQEQSVEEKPSVEPVDENKPEEEEEHAEGEEPEEGEEGQQSDEGKSQEGEEEPKPFSYIQMLDEPRALQEPISITGDYLKQICDQLGLIKVCWPVLTDVNFEGRTNFPESYLSNTNKEKLLLLYAENFRRQFCHQFPNRKPLLLACDNECGMQKMVSTTIRPTTLPYAEVNTWEKCSRFLSDFLNYEVLESPTLIPNHLYSPHTTCIRQSGHSFEFATTLCSLLVGLGYDAFVVSGYAVKDVTERIMIRVDSPYPPFKEEELVVVEEEISQKYRVAPQRELKSKFLEMMHQRELDKVKEEEEKLAEIERQRVLDEEKRPFDELEGQRVHAWILVLAGERNVHESFFIEPSTGLSHPLDTDLYCGIESVWSHQNYWVNLQDCSQGVKSMTYDLTNVEKWEHLLIGEPIKWRKQKPREIGEEDEVDDTYDEKHLDMPFSWSDKIDVPHEALTKRFPNGSRTTSYKKTLVEEYAPYVLDDGLVTKVTRFNEFACTEAETVEEVYENRHDKLNRSIMDVGTKLVTEYFGSGREDSVIKHIYYKNRDTIEEERTIFYNSSARFDGLAKVEVKQNALIENYSGREDKLYYRQVNYAERGEVSQSERANRRPIDKIVQKFSRDEEKEADDDISLREFNISQREIYLKYHYAKDHVTASTRTFIKPPISELGEGMTFKPELTSGYQAQIGAKPPRQLQLFLLLEKQLDDEKNVIDAIRDFENQIAEFLLLRAHEMAFSKLDVSLYNREQNTEFRTGMLEQEEKHRMEKEKEVEEEADYISPYFARLGNPTYFTFKQALDVKYECLADFKTLLVNRANCIQRHCEKLMEKVQTKQAWYSHNHDQLLPEQESTYFQGINDLLFTLKTLEMRLTRHKELSTLRCEALEQYLNNHPMLDILQEG